MLQPGTGPVQRSCSRAKNCRISATATRPSRRAHTSSKDAAGNAGPDPDRDRLGSLARAWTRRNCSKPRAPQCASSRCRAGSSSIAQDDAYRESVLPKAVTRPHVDRSRRDDRLAQIRRRSRPRVRASTSSAHRRLQRRSQKNTASPPNTSPTSPPAYSRASARNRKGRIMGESTPSNSPLPVRASGSTTSGARCSPRANCRNSIDNGLRGMTSNPTIFEHAIDTGTDYDAQLKWLDRQRITIRRSSSKRSPNKTSAARSTSSARCTRRRTAATASSRSKSRRLLAHDTQGTIDAAKRLWKEVNRPNLMIKIPGNARRLALRSPKRSLPESTST